MSCASAGTAYAPKLVAAIKAVNATIFGEIIVTFQQVVYFIKGSQDNSPFITQNLFR
jgi:hypothetical protein